MSAPNLQELAILEGTSATLAEAQERFGFNINQIASFAVAIGYHDAKKACQSEDPKQQATGKQLMLALANFCHGLSEYVLLLGQTIPAAQAAEIEGTAAGIAGEEDRERQIALTWCERLSGGKTQWDEIVSSLEKLEGDFFVVGWKMAFKLAKFLELSFDERWALVEIAAAKLHPDTLGRALWACELIPDDLEEAYDALLGLRRQDPLLAAAKPEQRDRFLKRLDELGARG